MIGRLQMTRTGYSRKLLSILAPCLIVTPIAGANSYVGASVAASFATLSKSAPQIIYYDGLLTDAYPLHNTHDSSAIFGVNGGYEFAMTPWKPLLAVGLGLYGNMVNYRYHGQVVETAAGDPSTTLYNYSYGINTTRLMAELQIRWMYGRVSPFINAGIGPSWNRLLNYKERAFNDTSFPPLPAFQTYTANQAAYQVGAGISTAFNLSHSSADSLQDWVSIGYRYVNSGKTSFGSRGAVYPYTLSTGSLETNEAYMSYTHLF